MTGRYYDAERFWNETLSDRFDLTGVGHGGFGPLYNEYLYRAKVRSFRRALRAARVSLAGATVLDVGCGTGVFAELATQAGCARYIGLDIAPVAVERLRTRYPQHAFETADIGERLAPDLLERSRSQVVLCLDVLYHVVDPVRFERAIGNLVELVEPDGHLVLVDAFWRRELVPGGELEPRPGRTPHVRYRAWADYDRLLFSRHGVEVVAVEQMYVLLNRPIEGTRWPWTSPRLSWNLRHRVLSRSPLPQLLYVLDTALTRVRRHGAGLKVAVVRRAVRVAG